MTGQIQSLLYQMLETELGGTQTYTHAEQQREQML